MKKLLPVMLVIMLAIVGLGGCSGSPLADAGMEVVSDSSYTHLDTSSSPLPEGGIKVDVVTGADGCVTFTVTDKEGNATVDYYQFTPADNTMLRHRYVAAMGKEYNYHFDCAAMELASVSDGEGEDVTQGLKMGGRWDSAAAETKEHAEKMIAYFEATFGMSMSEAVNQ
jgi:ABC-type oligopeptide transport system substrate-binding subunit